MANQTRTYTLNVDGNAAPSMSALRKEAKELDKTLGTLPAGSDEAAAALQRLADVRADMKDFRETLANMDAGERLKGVIGIAEGVAGAFSVATVAAKEFGLSGGSLEEYQSKVTGLIAVVQGLDSFREALEPKSWAGVKVIFGSITGGLASVRAAFSLTAIQARIASTTIRSALVATGVGALAIAIGLVIANFDKVKEIGGQLYQRFKPSFDGLLAGFSAIGDGIRTAFHYLSFGLVDDVKTAAKAARLAAEKEADALAAARAARLISGEKKYADAIDRQLGIDKRAAVARAKIESDSQVEQARVLLQAARDRVEALRGVRAADDELRARKLEANAEVAEAERNLTKAIADENKKRADKAKEEEKKAKDAAEKTAKDRLDIERNTSKLLIANITDETQRKLEELDEQAKQEKAAVKGTAEQRALQIQLIDEKLATDRAKTQADADKARLDKAKETAKKEVEILNEKELALAEVEVQQAQRDITRAGAGRLFQARIAQLEAQKNAELRNTELTEEQKLAIKEKYLTLTAQVERESAENNYQQIVGSIQRASQAAAGIVNQVAQDATALLDAQLQGLQDRLASLDTQLDATRSRIESDEKSLETATGARRAALIARIEQEKKAEASLAAEKRKAATEQARIEKDRQKLQERADQANRVAVAIETVLATVAMIRTAAKSGEFAGPAAPFVIAGTAAAGLAAAAALKSAIKFREGGLLDGPSHEQGGIRGRGAFGNIEAEGGEYILSKRAVQAIGVPTLEAMNALGRTRYVPSSSVRFAAGGVLPAPTATTQSGVGNTEVVEALGRIEQRLVSVEQAVMLAPTLLPRAMFKIGPLEAEAISEQQVLATQQKALATF